MPLELLKKLLNAVNPFSPAPPQPIPPTPTGIARAPQSIDPDRTPNQPRPASRGLEDTSVASLSRVKRPIWTPPAGIFGSPEDSTGKTPESAAHAEVLAAKSTSKAKIREYADRALCNFQYSYEQDEPEPAPARQMKGRREL